MDEINNKRIFIDSIKIESSGDYYDGILNMEKSYIQYGSASQKSHFLLLVILTYDSDNFKGNFKFQGEIRIHYFLPPVTQLDENHIYSCTIHCYNYFQDILNSLFTHRQTKPTIKISPLKDLKENIHNLLTDNY